jgi:anti-sigma factor RsiW
MNKHLSEDQIARCIVGQANIAEVQHARECSECGAEVKGFSNSVALFQSSIRDQIDDRIALVPTSAVSKPSRAGTQTPRWVLVAAASVVLVVLPFIRTGNKPEALPADAFTETDPDAVMNRVNLHLARTVPAPMEPLMLGIPDVNP